MKSPGDSGCLLVSEGADAATEGMAKDDNVLDPQRLDAEFERRAGAVLRYAVGFVRRHEVGDVADDQQLARRGIEYEFRRNPLVDAADDHHLRPLARRGQHLIAGPLGGKAPAEKGAVAVDRSRSGNTVRTPSGVIAA